ncbi:unnamed protein product [Nesidiocoris tenuis]|uniref:Uncharacterized protein n=1 Tax=Nesidiocoris tenuis TaxID=355587 RepID=A0A6H5GNK9_9HEMI|nr:unnamed protein product [Nesidiocoris tenuis]
MTIRGASVRSSCWILSYFRDSETSATSEPLIRQGRIINDPVTSPYRMRLPPRFALGPSPPHPRTHPSMRDPGHSHVSHGDLVAYPGQTDHISFPDHRDLVAFQPQVPAEYSERFAQMEAYKNGQKAILEATNDRKTSVVQKEALWEGKDPDYRRSEPEGNRSLYSSIHCQPLSHNHCQPLHSRHE